MDESTALIHGPHIEHVQPKDRDLYPGNGTLPPSQDTDVDVNEAWARLEVARRSAEFYMDKYFQHLRAESDRPDAAPNNDFGEEAPDAVAAQGQQLHDDRYWGTKAARDSLIGNLSEMSFWIEHLGPPSQPEVKVPVGMACFSGMAISGLQHVRSESLQAIASVGKGAALLTLVSSLGYMSQRLVRQEVYSQCKKSIAQCLDAAYSWTLADSHERAVKKYQYQVLRWLG